MNINNAIKSAIENYQAGHLKRAESILKKVLEVQSHNSIAINFLAIISYQLKDYDAAILYAEKLIRLDSTNAQAYYILGHSLQENKKFDEAITCYQKALLYNPGLTDAYYNLGTILQDQKRNDEAISCYQNALQINPNDFDACYNLGNIFQEKKQFDKAAIYYKKALELNPGLADAYNNLGIVLAGSDKLDEAIACYQKALQIDPNLADAYNNLGCAFKDKGQAQGQFDEAVVACCKKALEINPDLDKAYYLLTYQMQQLCSWSELEVLGTRLDHLTRKALDHKMKPAEPPFMSITSTNDPPINLAIAKSWSHDITRVMSELKIRFSFDMRKKDKTKIVLGYLSNDFCNHATAHLMLSLFGLHNRDNFSIHCYSYGKDDGSSYKSRIQQDSDKFIDISSLSDEASARQIHEDQVDILVDLKGYTKDARLEICALRPAPVQVSYLGFPGTTGADFIDYIITDKVVTPEDQSLFYTEKFVYMPHCYQVNDHTQAISEKGWKKVDF
jgi:protein O-GlcNAc transferase